MPTYKKIGRLRRSYNEGKLRQPLGKSTEIIEDFYKYVKTGNKSLIEKYSLEELKIAKYQYHQDSDREFYRAIGDRISELESKKSRRRDFIEKIIFLIIGFILGLASSFLSRYFGIK